MNRNFPLLGGRVADLGGGFFRCHFHCHFDAQKAVFLYENPNKRTKNKTAKSSENSENWEKEEARIRAEIFKNRPSLTNKGGM